jgi:hypothetical protein
VAAENAATMWTGLDISRKRAVFTTLMTVTCTRLAGGAPPVRPGNVCHYRMYGGIYLYKQILLLSWRNA